MNTLIVLLLLVEQLFYFGVPNDNKFNFSVPIILHVHTILICIWRCYDINKRHTPCHIQGITHTHILTKYKVTSIWF